MPWNPLDQGIALFDIQQLRIVESVPFMSLSVYANSDRRYVLYYIREKEWAMPVPTYSYQADVPLRYMFARVNVALADSIIKIPKPIQAMALLLS
jgi:hypothetical protein